MRNLILAGLVLAAALSAKNGVTAQKVVADGVAAQVNSNFITIGDVLSTMAPVQRQILSKFSGPDVKPKLYAAYTNTLNSLIERRLVLDAYEKMENKFPDQYIDGRVDEITQDMFNGDKTELMAALAKEKLNYEEWRKDMRDHVIYSTMKKMNVDQNVTLSVRAVKKAYEENVEKYRAESSVKLRMIVVDGGATEEAKAAAVRKISTAWKKIDGGAGFSEVAKEFSEGSNAAGGGVRDPIQMGKLRPELARAAASLKPGEVSGIITAGDQFYIIMVDERKDSFADLQPQIERELRRNEAEKAYAVWIQRLRGDAYVKLFDVDVFE